MRNEREEHGELEMVGVRGTDLRLQGKKHQMQDKRHSVCRGGRRERGGRGGQQDVGESVKLHKRKSGVLFLPC